VAPRDRGRIRAAEILSGKDMRSAKELAEWLHISRVTINTKRQNGQLLGLDGAKPGFRFPVWQLNRDGKPYPELPALRERLGGPWAVFRFLVQVHDELDGSRGPGAGAGRGSARRSGERRTRRFSLGGPARTGARAIYRDVLRGCCGLGMQEGGCAVRLR
jgi:hypothetical protein